MSESNEQEESTSAAADLVEEDQAFQETYLEATGAKFPSHVDMVTCRLAVTNESFRTDLKIRQKRFIDFNN